MLGIWVWLGLAAGLAIIVVLRQRWKLRGPIGTAASELRRLCDALRSATDASSDLPDWERARTALERYPSDYNKLNGEIEFVDAFTAYLERHFPNDPRLESLRMAKSYRKSSIWGFNIRRD
jgi:hypothetical protein